MLKDIQEVLRMLKDVQEVLRMLMDVQEGIRMIKDIQEGISKDGQGCSSGVTLSLGNTFIDKRKQ